MPLQPLPLAAQSYGLASKPAAGQRLLNMYAERMPEGSRSPFILKPTPGLVPFRSIGSGPIWAMASMPGFLYVVSGTEFFRFKSDGTGLVFLGDIGTSGAAHSIAIGDRQVVVCNPPRAFVGNHEENDVHEITAGSGNFPQGGASAVSYLDGYFAFTAYNGTFFFVSNLLDGENFDSLDYARSERRPDIVQFCASHNGEFWLFGMHSISVWYNAGAADFPFRERAGSVQDRGIASLRTLAALDRSLVFLGNDRVVYRSNGYQLTRISDHAVEERLSRYQDLRAITGCSFVWEGHETYVLRMPGAEIGGATQPGLGTSFVYDGSTGLWHERSTFQQQSFWPWRIDRAQRFGVDTMVAGWIDGRVFTMSAGFHTDDGDAIRREVILPPMTAVGARQFMSRVEIEMDVGSGEAPGGVLLDWSDDGGRTFTQPRTISTGATGATRTRVAATRLGSFRQRSLRLQAQGRMTVYSVDADIEKGAH